MIALAWIFLLAASSRVELESEVHQIPAAEWRYVELDLRQRPALVTASFEVQSGSRQVRVALMTRDDLERLRNDLPHGVIAVTEPGKSGTLSYRVRRRGDYVLVVDNRVDGSKPAAVQVRIALDFAAPPEPEVTQISPGRQLAVVAVSMVFFVGVLTFSARRLWRATRGSSRAV
jgi:hypothetical protein